MYIYILCFPRLTVSNMTSISLPTEESTEEINKQLNEKIEQGIYKLGELIIPQVYEKVTLQNNKLTTQEIEIRGRRVNLLDIRRDMFEKHKKFMKLHSNEQIENLSQTDVVNLLRKIHEYTEDDDKETLGELRSRLKKIQRTRNLMFWHDGSTLGGHGHILMMVAVMYDPAVFLTDLEYFQINGVLQNVQSIIEKPFMYLLARSPSTDQQLLYGDVRINDILQLKEEINVGHVKITDVMRCFKGDHPAAQFEAGQQKGGNYACHICPVNAHCAKSIVHSFKCKAMSIQERIDKVTCTFSSKEKIKQGKIKLYHNLKAGDLVEELHSREVKFSTNQKVKDLQAIFESEMHGIQRLPALLFYNPLTPLSDLNLTDYEILANEPLHDISNHIKNIQDEIPYHVPRNIKTKVKEVIKKSYQDKAAKNAADHRRSLLLITNWFQQNLSDHYTTKILESFTEIQEILYLPDKERSLQSVFRLTITTFIHSMLLKIYIDGNVLQILKGNFLEFTTMHL